MLVGAVIILALVGLVGVIVAMVQSMNRQYIEVMAPADTWVASNATFEYSTPTWVITETPLRPTLPPTWTPSAIPTHSLSAIISLEETEEVPEPDKPIKLESDDRLIQTLKSVISQLGGIKRVISVSATQSDAAWELFVEVELDPIFDDQLSSELIMLVSIPHFYPMDLQRVEVRTFDGNQPMRIWRWVDGEWYEEIIGRIPPTVTLIPIRVEPVSPFNACPSNCTQARAWGVSAYEAAACGLDRDGDGVACYGD